MHGNRKFTDAISVAMDFAVSNTPILSGKTLVAIDCSGSMSKVIDKAAIFGATLVKANENANIILYDTNVKELTISTRSPVIDISQHIKREAMGGGTETSLVFRYAQQKAKNYDRIIIISDNESWNEYSVQAIYNEYKKVTDTDPFVYAIDMEGYGTKDITGGRVFHLCGWSNRLLDFIIAVEKGDTFISYIKNYESKNTIVDDE